MNSDQYENELLDPTKPAWKPCKNEEVWFDFEVPWPLPAPQHRWSRGSQPVAWSMSGVFIGEMHAVCFAASHGVSTLPIRKGLLKTVVTSTQ